jgi:predicted transcriptional regulator
MKQLHKWKDIKAAGRSAERVRQLEQEALDELRDMDLRAIREAAGLTQEELAAKVDISQSHLSRMEGGELGSLPTLRKVVQALGGEIEVTAIINGKRVRLAGA